MGGMFGVKIQKKTKSKPPGNSHTSEVHDFVALIQEFILICHPVIVLFNPQEEQFPKNEVAPVNERILAQGIILWKMFEDIFGRTPLSK